MRNDAAFNRMTIRWFSLSVIRRRAVSDYNLKTLALCETCLIGKANWKWLLLINFYFMFAAFCFH